jgi:putative ABC transport system permease protein
MMVEETGASNVYAVESGARLLGWTNEEAIGKTLINGGINGTIIGVVKDFHVESLHEPIAPIVFITYAPYRQMSVLISTSATKAGIDHIEKVWNKFVSQDQFEYEFLNERYDRLCQSAGTVFHICSAGNFYCIIGTVRLTTFNAIQRSKGSEHTKIIRSYCYKYPAIA